MALKNGLLLIVKSAGVGVGEMDLAEKIAAGFFNVLSQSNGQPARTAFINSGVFLTAEGPPVIAGIKRLQKHGAEILSCGTRLDYYCRTERLPEEKPTDINQTVNAMLGFDKGVAL